jgi:hypothetical protein
MRRSTLVYILVFAILAGVPVALNCASPASTLSPVAPIVTADDCQKLTTCGECISNTACGWCGNSCVAATSADARETAPKTCTGAWVWQLGTCPDTNAEETPAAKTEP